MIYEAGLATWVRTVEILWTSYRRSPWDLGDLINDGIAEFTDGGKDEVADLMTLVSDQLEVSPKTIANYGRVAREFPPDERVPSLEMSHHEAVMRLELEERRKWLTKAAEEQWTVMRLRQELKDGDEPQPGLTTEDVKEMLAPYLESVKVYRRGIVIQGAGFKLIGRSNKPITWAVKEW